MIGVESAGRKLHPFENSTRVRPVAHPPTDQTSCNAVYEVWFGISSLPPSSLIKCFPPLRYWHGESRDVAAAAAAVPGRSLSTCIKAVQKWQRKRAFKLPLLRHCWVASSSSGRAQAPYEKMKNPSSRNHSEPMQWWWNPGGEWEGRNPLFRCRRGSRKWNEWGKKNSKKSQFQIADPCSLGTISENVQLK